MLLPRHSVGTYLATNSHTTHQGTLSHSHLSSLSHCGLILAKEWNKCAQANLHFKKKKTAKKRRQGINHQTFSQNPHLQGKSHHREPFT